MKTLLIAIFLGVACSAPARETKPGQPVSTNEPVTGDGAMAGPDALQMKAVDSLIRSRHRLMEVQVVMASDADRDTQFEYSTRWYDAAGMLIPSFTGAWFSGEISGLGTALIHEIAPSPDAVKLEIVCREVFRNSRSRTHSQPLLLCFHSNSN